MAKKKAMPKLVQTSDYVTGYVERIWGIIRACAEDTNDVYPMLTYSIHGTEFSVPMSYPMFLDLGQQMVATPALFPVLLTQMGIEFALLAMRMAKSEPGARDNADFVHEAEIVLHGIRPDCVVFSAPVRAVRGRSRLSEKSLTEAWARGPDAVAVVGRNPVRTFTMVRPFVRDPMGRLHFGEVEVLDSLGGCGQDHGYFSHVFDPNQN